MYAAILIMALRLIQEGLLLRERGIIIIRIKGWKEGERGDGGDEEGTSPLSGMVRRAATALMADLFSSSCFSYSCLTELAFAFDCMVDRSGSINFSIPAVNVT